MRRFKLPVFFETCIIMYTDCHKKIFNCNQKYLVFVSKDYWVFSSTVFL